MSFQEGSAIPNAAHDECRRDHEANADTLDASMERSPAYQQHDANPELERDRRANDQKLKSRFERLFEKYARDFSGIGDEIDISTGEIVVDNGHLKNMQHEADPGTEESSKLLNDFTKTLEHEDEDVDDGEGEESTGLSDVDGRHSRATSPDDEDTSSDTSLSIAEPTTYGNTIHGLADVPIDPALLNMSATFAEYVDPPTLTEEQRPSSTVAEDSPLSALEPRTSIASTVPEQPADLLDITGLPAVQDTLLSLHQYQSGAVDSEHIRTFGLKIADQIARFLSDRSSVRMVTKRKDLAWSYPELPAFKKAKTAGQRPSLPHLSKIISSPSDVSSTDSTGSVWAPLQHPRPRKSRNTPARAVSATANGNCSQSDHPARDPVSQNGALDELGDLHKCANCGIAATTAWRTGPEGAGTLCNACGMYYYRYGLLKPLREPTPDPESEGEEDDCSKINSRRIRAPIGRNARFTVEEDALIIKLKEVDKLSWERIARYFGGRSHYAVQCRYSKNLLGDSAGRRALLDQGFTLDGLDETGPEMTFTRDQDVLLVQLRDEEKMEWKFVAKHFPGKDGYAVEARYNILMGIPLDPEERRKRKRANPKYSRAKAPKNHGRSFSPEEDELLIKLREVKKLPWEILAQEFTERTWLSLQKRYVRTLAQRLKIMKEGGDDPYMHLFLDADNISDDTLDGRPDRKRVQEMLRQRREEDENLLRLKDEEGLTFEEIAEKMPGRTVVSLMNRYKCLRETMESVDEPQHASLVATKSVTGSPTGDDRHSNAKTTGFFDNSDEQNPEQETAPLAAAEEDPQAIMPSLVNLSMPSRVQDVRVPGNDTSTLSFTHPRPSPSSERLQSLSDDGYQSGTGTVQDSPTPLSHSETPCQAVMVPEATFGQMKRSAKYSTAEQEMILKLRSEGFAWEQIAERLPGRTPRSIACFYSAYTGVATKRNASNGKRTLHAQQTGQNRLLRQVLEKAASLVDEARSTVNGNTAGAASKLINMLQRESSACLAASNADGGTELDLDRLATILAQASKEVTNFDGTGVEIKTETEDDDVLFLSAQPSTHTMPVAPSEPGAGQGEPSKGISDAHKSDRTNRAPSLPTTATSPSLPTEELPQPVTTPHLVEADSADPTSAPVAAESSPGGADVPQPSNTRAAARGASGKRGEQAAPRTSGHNGTRSTKQPRRKK